MLVKTVKDLQIFSIIAFFFCPQEAILCPLFPFSVVRLTQNLLRFQKKNSYEKANDTIFKGFHFNLKYRQCFVLAVPADQSAVFIGSSHFEFNHDVILPSSIVAILSS